LTPPALVARPRVWRFSKVKSRLGNWSGKKSTEHGMKVPCSVLYLCVFKASIWPPIAIGEPSCNSLTVSTRVLGRTLPYLEYEEFRNGSSKGIPDLSGRLLPIPA